MDEERSVGRAPSASKDNKEQGSNDASSGFSTNSRKEGVAEAKSNANPVSFIPAAALKRFADGLGNSNPATNKFLQINRDRVQTFIEKPAHPPANARPSLSSPSAPQRKYKVPGIYQYSFPTAGSKQQTSILQLQEMPEFQSSLGSRSRFGEGDGSFFDRWLNSDTISSKQVLDKDGLPIMRFSLQDVQTGYKRHLKPPPTDSKQQKPENYVTPYAERRKARLEKDQREREQREKEEAAKALADSLAFDPPHEDSDHNKLPSVTKQLTAVEKENYFGSGARQGFFEYYQHLSRRRTTDDIVFDQSALATARSTNTEDYATTMVSEKNLLPSNSLMAKPYDAIKNNGLIKERFARKASNITNINKPSAITTTTADHDDWNNDDIAEGGDRKVQIEQVMHDNEDEPRLVSSSNRMSYSRMRQRYDPAGGQASEEEKQLLLDHLLGLEKSYDEDNIATTMSRLDTADLAISTTHEGGQRPVSARSKYLKGCVALGLRPQPSLIIRKEITSLLNLSSMGIGDEMAAVLASSLHLLPALEGLLIADNHLSDYSLVPMIEQLGSCKHLNRLDLSNNLLERDGLRALQLLLSSPRCMLVDLKLQKLGLDDLSVYHLAEAIVINYGNHSGHNSNHRLSSLRSLDLSYNELGSLSFTHSQLSKRHHKLAGEALGQLLSMDTCRLTTLKLSWNKIRGPSGVSLARSLKANKSLTHLDLNYNNLGVDGGEALGESLHYNTTLKTLQLTHNNITARPAMVISSGIKSCESLLEVDLSENPIGEEGARAILVLNISYGQRVKVEIRNCSVKVKDPTNCWFKGLREKGKVAKKEYTLELEKPYDRAVCMELMRAMMKDSDLTFARTGCKYIGPDEPSSSTTGVELPLTLYTGPATSSGSKAGTPRHERARSIPDNANNNNNGLYSIEASFKSVKSLFRSTASRVFEQIDFDGRGGLDRQDIASLLDQLGFDSAWEMVESLMNLYDIDGTGRVEEEEFVCFLLDLKRNYEKEETNSKLVRYFTVDSLATNKVQAPTPYLPPNKGRLVLTIEENDKENTDQNNNANANANSNGWTASAMTLSQVQSFLEAAKGLSLSSDKDQLLQHALQSTQLCMADAKPIFHALVREVGSVLRVLLQLLPQMATATDARMLIAYVTNHDYQQIQHLKYLLGPLYKVFTGLPNGFYQLNLNESTDRDALNRLIKMSKAAAEVRRKAEKGDTSQYGNWSSFRNMILNGKPIILSDENLEEELPDKGRLDFDFVLLEIIPMSEKEIPNLRLFRLLTALGMVKEDRRKRVFTKLRMNVDEGRSTSKGNGQRRFETMPFAAQEISEGLHGFYGAAAAMRKVRPFTVEVEHEEMAVLKKMKTLKRLNAAAMSNSGKDSGSGNEKGALGAMMTAGRSPSGDDGDKDYPPPMLGNVKRHHSELFQAPSSPPQFKQQQEEKTSQQNSAIRSSIGNYSSMEWKNMDMYGDHLKDLLTDYSLDPAFIAARYSDALEVILAGRYLCSAQLGMIIERLPFGNTPLDAFGTYRVELVVSLFSRVIDKVNFEYVTKELDNVEMAMLIFRLGWLNLWNPLKPEGNICLDLSRHEERQIARMLVTLNFVETGETWQEPKFKETRDGEPIPDWTLPHSWYAEESLPVQGILSLNYFSGKGVELEGCLPNVPYRMSLMSLVLALPYEEDYEPLVMDVIVDEAERYVEKAGMALSFLQKNQVRPATTTAADGEGEEDSGEGNEVEGNEDEKEVEGYYEAQVDEKVNESVE